MPDTTLPHPQGSVCWLDTLLVEQDAALGFYQPLLGWSGAAEPADPNAYAVQRVRGKAVAGIGRMPAGEPLMPWTGYFAVHDVDAAVARITEHGGEVVCAATDAPGQGRFAHGKDPSGAAFGLWQGDPFQGFELSGEPGCLYWFELLTTQGKACAEFYAALLECETPDAEVMPGSYWTIRAAGEDRAGIFQVEEVERPHWRAYFHVADVDLAIAAALAAGAHVTDPAMDTPFGRMATLVDPVGLEIRIATPPPGR